MTIQRTLSIIKPDATSKNIIGKIIDRFEENGLKVVAGKLIHMDQAKAAGFYAEHEGRPFFPNLVEYMTSAPVFVQVLEGENAVLKNYKVDKFENKNIKYSFNNIDQDKNSVSETFILSSGSNFSKNEINCNLNGVYASAFVNGVFSLNNDKHHEIRSIINHLTENTKSYQLLLSTWLPKMSFSLSR